ncbi:MAG: hypothetical protein ACMUIA_01895 [bacterium]
MELVIKDLPEDVYKLLTLMSAKDGKSIDQIVIEAIKDYYEIKEITYRKGMLNFDQDDGYQEKDQ